MPKNKRIHFVGIGGASLNGLAQVLAARGDRVSGSDLVASPVTDELQKKGITVIIGQRAENISDDIDEVIISSAVSGGPGAVEVAAARELKIPVYKRTVIWSRLMSEAKIAVAVAGTHGKTSTTAMLGHILNQAGLKPTVLVGGTVPDFQGSVLVGGRDCVVLEADEYDHAFYAARPTLTIITNIDFDHPDTYPTPAAYLAAYKRFARLVGKRHGRLIIYGDSPTTRRTFSRWKQIPISWYGQRNLWPGLKLHHPGQFMLLNATAAAKAAHELGVAKQVIITALNSFAGVSRRFELIGYIKKIPVYDDFAHHPTELAATIKTAKKVAGSLPLAVLFQPHQRVRTKYFADDFTTVLSQADIVGIMPLYNVAGREQEISITSYDIVIKNKKFMQVSDKEVSTFLHRAAESCGCLLVAGAGSISATVKGVLQHEKD